MITFLMKITKRFIRSIGEVFKRCYTFVKVMISVRPKNNQYFNCISVKIEQKLSLFYLLNDVVQHSKRKNYNEVLERFQSVVKEAMPHLKDESIYSKVKRCIDIWAERGVFNEKYIGELTRILEAGRHSTAEVVDSFQPNQLCTQMKIMKALEDDTEYKLKTVSEADLEDILDEASVRQKLKDRQHGNDCIQEVEDGRKKLEDYIKAVDREISKRRQVKDLLEQAKKYYDSLYGEANIVATVSTYTSVVVRWYLLLMIASLTCFRRIHRLGKKLKMFKRS